MSLLLWGAIAVSMAAWAWASLRGGRLDDREFIAFSLALMAGQAAGSVEAFSTGAVGTAASQAYFFAFTLWGVVRRLRPWPAAPAGEAAARPLEA